jgi:hypothetical protein
VWGDPFGGESGGASSVAERERDPVAKERVEGDVAGAHAGEERPGLGASDSDPGVEGGDGVGVGMVAAGDPDALPGSFLIDTDGRSAIRRPPDGTR